jgi:transcriptional regulator with XRE-family HTH domain
VEVVAAKIKEARVTRLGMTQVELAAALSLDPATISRWERGQEPRPHHVRALAQLTGLPVQWFYTEDGVAA